MVWCSEVLRKVNNNLTLRNISLLTRKLVNNAIMQDDTVDLTYRFLIINTSESLCYICSYSETNMRELI